MTRWIPLYVGSALGLTLLGGCALVGPDHQTPKTEVSATFVNARQPGLSSRPVHTRWWQGFKDRKLEWLVDRAVAGNLDLRIAGARLREARALWDETAFDRYPTVTAGASYTDQQRSAAALQGFRGAQRDFEIFRTGFDAFWELDFFGRVRRSVEVRSAEAEASEAGLHDVLVSLLAEVARNYFELRGAQNQLAVARRNAENQRQTLDLTVALLEGGRGTTFDTARARAQLEATLAGIPPLETAIRRAMHRLAVLTGSQPATLVTALERPEPLPAAPPVVTLGRPEDLLRRRPDIRAVERRLAAATASIGVATADLFPRVTFVGSIAVEGRTFAGMFSGGNEAYSFGPQIRWAALDIGRVRARIRQADARAEASLAEYELTVLRALEETENALVELGRQQARRDHLRTSSDASEEAAQQARQRFEEGAVDFLAVLDAERTMLEAQDRLARSETDTVTALVALYKALGGGWERDGGETADGRSEPRMTLTAEHHDHESATRE